MKRLSSLFLCLFAVFSLTAQQLPFRLEELTAPDFIKAVEKSSKTCILPIGVFEKHGPHLPLGTDLYAAREFAIRAAEKEYTIVFPWYYFNSTVDQLVKMIQAVKKDEVTPALQKQFFDESEKPLKTKQ